MSKLYSVTLSKCFCHVYFLYFFEKNFFCNKSTVLVEIPFYSKCIKLNIESIVYIFTIFLILSFKKIFII